MPTQTIARPEVKGRWILKGCLRCRGDMYLTDDTVRQGVFVFKERHWQCLQCGWSHEITGMGE